MARWGFLTNQALVLIHVYEHPRSTLREIAADVGITERAALSLLRQLEGEHFVERAKEGRRNRYTVDLAVVLAAQTQGPYNVAQLVGRLANLAAELRTKGEARGASRNGGNQPENES